MCELRDNVGDNISHKNKNYCELTALYWIMKNVQLPEYVGFNFYSRIFDFTEAELSYILSAGINAIVPEPELLSPLHFLTKVALRNSDPVEDILERAISKTHPSYLGTYRAILKEAIVVPSNIFILQRDIFNDYSKWLFEVLTEYETMLIESGSDIPPRHVGYVAERLQSIWFLKNSSELDILFAKRKFLFW